ncbi:MAG: signal peptidase I [Oscillospiraceae bacterium]|jgi:signal peptidase|nr:signal peptidase I [Oscillospiraceae bacterium]
MNRVIKIALLTFRVAVLAALVAVLAVNIYMSIAKARGITVPMVFGYSYLNVLTGSMEPDIETGSLVVVSARAPYGVGDTVTFESGGVRPVTHRIVSINGDVIRTQGVANNTPDAPITRDAIRGKVVRVLPGVGNLLTALREPDGLLFLLSVVIAVLFLPRYIIEFITGERLGNAARGTA